MSLTKSGELTVCAFYFGVVRVWYLKGSLISAGTAHLGECVIGTEMAQRELMGNDEE